MIAHKLEGQELVTSYEASELGFKPGRWPKKFMVTGKEVTFQTAHFNKEHELISIDYMTGDKVIRVYND